jgi:hypothetical protein
MQAANRGRLQNGLDELAATKLRATITIFIIMTGIPIAASLQPSGPRQAGRQAHSQNLDAATTQISSGGSPERDTGRSSE